MNKISRQVLVAAVESAGMRKQAKVELADLLRFIPMAGGAAHGVARPEHGASRGETGLYEGLLGALGGGAGFVGGADIGSRVLRANRIADPNMDLLRAIAMLGSSLGTAIGTVPGRALARRDIPDRKELEDLAKALEELRKSDGGGTSITINSQAAEVNPSSGAPLEADKESGEEQAVKQEA